MNSNPDIRRILVPHDFSDTAESALSYAVSLAKKFEARVTVLHAYEVPTLGSSEALVASLEFASEIERAAGKALDEIAERTRKAGVNVETMIRRGTPWLEINATAEQMKVDLIVMGTHGRKGVSRVLLGSVAEKVVRTAPCPVLTVHGGASQPDPSAGASARPQG
jgi:nucleotide-binding universal stress UspA family protein